MSRKTRRFWPFVNKVCGSPAATTAIALISAIGGIYFGLHRPTIKPLVSVAASGSATAQSSSDSQSPNLSGGQRNVQIIYGSTTAPSPAPSSRAVTSQSSTGDQSPNINGVDGDVDIRYGSPDSRSQNEIYRPLLCFLPNVIRNLLCAKWPACVFDTTDFQRILQHQC